MQHPDPSGIAAAFLIVLALAGLLALFARGATRGTRLGIATGAAALVVAFTLSVAPGAALAAEGPTVYAVTLPKGLVPMLLDYIFVGLLAGLLWLGRRAAAWLHLSRESMLVQRFDHGAEAALNYARERVLAKAGSSLDHMNTRSEMVKVAGEYLLPKLPGVLKELKIDPAGLHERLTARLDLAAPLAPASAAASLPR